MLAFDGLRVEGQAWRITSLTAVLVLDAQTYNVHLPLLHEYSVDS